MLNAFRIEKSDIEVEAVFKVAFSVKATSTIMEEMEDFQWMVLLLNLAWFLANQITFTVLITADKIVTLHWEDHDLFNKAQQSSTFEMTGTLRVKESHLQML